MSAHLVHGVDVRCEPGAAQFRTFGRNRRPRVWPLWTHLRHEDQGAATVFACLALAGLIAVTLLIGQVGVAVVTRHRAQAAADLAALAAATRLVEGVEVGCAAATEVARRMGARVRGCEVAEWDATVIVERNVPIGLLGVRMVRAVARAGPVVK
ncbi:Rv3654c family TadE-like protein [Nocardia brasiliensis]|uniref:Rv3654c family TadE-like protein n=1 Tax=Nocardia brasiliensis TaxID=37326 RepID=UPI0033FA73F1